MASTFIIFNPVAGRSRVHALWPEIASTLTGAGIKFDAAATTAPGHAVELARTAAGRYSSIVAVGGDGTLSEVANGLMQATDSGQPAPFGIVPLGNGDDFVKVLPPEPPVGGRGYDWRAAIAKIAAGQTRLFDIGRLSTQDTSSQTPHYFLNIVDVGFGAHTVANFASVPEFLTGNAAYFAAVLKTIINYPVLKISIQQDNQAPLEQLSTMTAIGNGRCFGGGFWVCPDAVPHDGLLDVMIADKVSRLNILGLLPKMKRGTHVNDPLIKMSRARRIVLQSETPFHIEADGEMPFGPQKQLAVDVLPAALRLIV